MLLRRRPPGIDNRPPDTTKRFQHLDPRWIAVLRWLNANRVNYVLVGAVAEAVRGHAEAKGPVSIVPAPYYRNFERLARALTSEQARLRVDVGDAAGADTTPAKLTAEKLARGQRWTLRCGDHDLDIEGRPPGVPSYQELLYEAARFDLSPDVSIEVASPEDIAHYEHLSRTGFSPEITITRRNGVEQDQV
jgi:hypothetical protein